MVGYTIRHVPGSQPPFPLIPDPDQNKEDQLGKLWGAQLKIAKLKFALSGQSPANTRSSLQAVAKMAVVDSLRNLLHAKHQNEVQNTSLPPIALKSMHFYLPLISENRAKSSSCLAQYLFARLLYNQHQLYFFL